MYKNAINFYDNALKIYHIKLGSDHNYTQRIYFNIIKVALEAKDMDSFSHYLTKLTSEAERNVNISINIF